MQEKLKDVLMAHSKLVAVQPYKRKQKAGCDPPPLNLASILKSSKKHIPSGLEIRILEFFRGGADKDQLTEHTCRHWLISVKFLVFGTFGGKND